jgi:hypothetical protein
MAKGNRYRIYDAERSPNRMYFTTTDAAQGWLNWVCRTKWWKERTTIKHIDLQYPSYSMSGSTKIDDTLAKVEIYCYSLDVLTLCHEITHLIDWRPKTLSQEKCHDARFAGIELLVVKRYMGLWWYNELLRSFEKEGVKFDVFES